MKIQQTKQTSTIRNNMYLQKHHIRDPSILILCTTQTNLHCFYNATMQSVWTYILYLWHSTSNRKGINLSICWDSHFTIESVFYLVTDILSIATEQNIEIRNRSRENEISALSTGAETKTLAEILLVWEV